MTEITLVSFGLNMLYFVVGLLVVWGMLRMFDKLAGGSFSDARAKMAENPMALAVYFGARFLGVCVLGAAFVGA